MQLDVFEYQSSGEDLKIESATTLLYFFGKNQKKTALGKGNATLFANLEEGIYSAEVIADSYQKSIRRIHLDCGSAEQDRLIKKRVSMWKGSPKESVNVIEDDDYSKISDKLPINDLASKVKKAEYPPVAQAVHASGAVAILTTVDELGNVISARAISGHPLLQMGATEAAKKN